MARTTINIEKGVLRQLKAQAASEGRTLQAVVNEHLKRAVAASAVPLYRLRLAGWRAEPQPSVDLFERHRLFDLMDRRCVPDGVPRGQRDEAPGGSTPR